MKLLLDTHSVLWWLLGDIRLPVAVRAEIARDENDVLVSAASAMEISTKYRLGKLPEAKPIAGRLLDVALARNLRPLAIGVDHGDLAGALSIPHRDPFDRLLIAQAQIENAYLVSNERLFDDFGVRRLW